MEKDSVYPATDAGVELPRRRFFFPKRARLRLQSDFDRVFNGSKGIAGRCIVVWVRIYPESVGGRLGAVASKRTFHDAVDRNRAKRLVREAFRSIRHEFASCGWDAVVVARARISRASSRDVAEELRAIMIRCGVPESGCEKGRNISR